jgi:NAD(P)-dependent dehydrogenase (short-subunit alcohol dehydrogenase family)
MDRLQNKVAVVTGGAKGIGRAACHLMAEEGAKIALTDISDEKGQEVVTRIKEAGGEAWYWHLDVSKEEDVAQAFSEIHGKFGKIDVLVNNAGIAGIDKPTHEIPNEEWMKVLAVNVNGVFYCTKHAIAYMKNGSGGSIINLSSIYGIISAPDIPPYHASKGAVRLMTKTDALLYAKDSIRVNSIHPGYIWTPLVEDMAKKSDEGEEGFRKKLDNLHPIGHIGEPEDIAYGIVYLASDEAKFVTGSELIIDGGYTAQ